MDKVKVHRQLLLATLIKNRIKHAKQHEAVFALFQLEEQKSTNAVRYFKGEFEELKKQVVAKFPDVKVPDFILMCSPRPFVSKSFDEDYKQAIDLITVSHGHEVELDAKCVDMYMYDKWDWKEKFNGLLKYYGVDAE